MLWRCRHLAILEVDRPALWYYLNCQKDTHRRDRTMTISELIQTLTTIQSEHGDVDLGQVTLFDGEDLFIDYYDEDGDCTTIHVEG